MMPAVLLVQIPKNLDCFMTNIAGPSLEASNKRDFIRPIGLVICVLAAIAIIGWLANTFKNLGVEDELLLDSTLGELAVWMAQQTEEDKIGSYLGQYAENWAQSLGEESLAPEIMLETMRNNLVWWCILMGVSGLIGLVLLLFRPLWTSYALLFTLIGTNILFFLVPVIAGDNSLWFIIAGIILLLIALLMAPGKVSRVVGFFVALSVLLIVWESSKAFAEAVNYKISIGQPSWVYSEYDIPEMALDALQIGEVDAIVLDRNDLSDFMISYPNEDELNPEDFPYPNLRYLEDLKRQSQVSFFTIEPEFPGRLSVAVREDDLDKWSGISDFTSENIATVTGEFGEERYLAVERRLLLVDLKILNNLNLPHLQTIAEALLQPARRNGSQLLIRILADAGTYTWSEALAGFLIGAILGFTLGTVFAHSHLMERSLLPYVVASQTVPILALAPMVVIWMGASQFSVSVIAAYLTFFPVTINTLRGLQSPKPTAVELMQSYAASQWTILWKLRVPAALPYIFTALKVSATASVVGAIIGELPSGIGDGLGRAILDFSSDYSLISTPKLWASILVAASVGIFFFVAVSILEELILGRYIRNN
jgi:NitT/TauT family transport system permease protein